MVRITIVEKNAMLQFDKDVTKNRHAVKVLTQKGICGTVLPVQYLPSGEHKNYANVLLSNSTNTKHISGDKCSCNYAYIICSQVEVKHMGILSKDF